MNKIVTLNEVPSDYKYKYLGEGTNGACYLTKDGQVYKEYKDQGVYDEETERLLELDYPGFTFPKQLIFIDDIFKGYIKDYAQGKTIESIEQLKDIRKFIEALKEFETNVMDFSYETELYLYDLNLRNLLYNENKNEIIDIDTDVISSFDYHLRNPYFENLKELSNNLEYKFFPIDYKSSTLNDMKIECIVGGYTRPSKLMEYSIKEMEKEIEVKSLDDYNKGLNLIKK